MSWLYSVAIIFPMRWILTIRYHELQLWGLDCNQIQFFNIVILRNVLFSLFFSIEISYFFNWSNFKPKDTQSWSILYYRWEFITRPTFERRATLSLLRSINPNMINHFALKWLGSTSNLKPPLYKYKESPTLSIIIVHWWKYNIFSQ